MCEEDIPEHSSNPGLASAEIQKIICLRKSFLCPSIVAGVNNFGVFATADKVEMHLENEMENFVETHPCKQRVKCRSRVLWQCNVHRLDKKVNTIVSMTCNTDGLCISAHTVV